MSKYHIVGNLMHWLKFKRVISALVVCIWFNGSFSRVVVHIDMELLSSTNCLHTVVSNDL